MVKTKIIKRRIEIKAEKVAKHNERCYCTNCQKKAKKNKKKSAKYKVSKVLCLTIINLVIWGVSIDGFSNWYGQRGSWVFENASAAVFEETSLIETAQSVSGGLVVSGTAAKSPASVAVSVGGNQLPSVSGSAIEVSIRETFPEDPGTALAIAKGESGLDPYAIGYNCHYYKENGKRYSASCKKEDIGKHWSVDCGLWQINIIAKECPKHLFNPEVNTQEARKKYDTVWNGVQRKWSPWVAYWNGQYKNHMN